MVQVVLDFFSRAFKRSRRPKTNSRRRSKNEPREFFSPVTQFPSFEMTGSAPVVAGEEVAVDANLGARVVKGASWTVAGTIWTQMLGVARTVVLARLLSQDDFGMAAMALTVSGAIYTLTNTGIVASVVSARFDDEDELNSYVNLVWTLELGRGVLIAMLIALGAFPFSHFYGEPRLLPVLLVLALEPLFPINIGLLLQSRRVEMRRVTLNGLFANTLSVAATLGLALWTRNYWALVWGQIVGSIASTIFSFVLSSYRPRLSWNAPLARRAFDFGKFQFVIGLCNYALGTMDNVLVGFFYGAKTLGVYAVAYSFCTMARSLVNNAFSTVLFPAFASAGREDDPTRLRSLVERAFTLGVVVMTGVLVPLIAYAPAIVRILFPKFGLAAVEPMRWLLIAGWFAGLLSLFSAFFVGLDRPRIESNSKLIDAGLFLVILLPLTRFYGVVGAAQAGAITWALATVWRWKWANALAPGALKRLPFLVVSAALVGGLATYIGLVPWALRSGLTRETWLQAFHPGLPALGTAWLQLLLGGPCIAALCVLWLSGLHPVARLELESLGGKLAARLGRRQKPHGQNPA